MEKLEIMDRIIKELNNGHSTADNPDRKNYRTIKEIYVERLYVRKIVGH